MHVGFARAKIAALNRIVKKTLDAVAVVGVIFCGVDASLRGDAVCATRAVLITKTLDVVAEFAQRGGGSSSRET